MNEIEYVWMLERKRSVRTVPTIDCAKCGNSIPQENGPVCPHCGNDHSGSQ